MKIAPNLDLRRVLPFRRQSPMLTALMVYFVGLCMVASIAACAVWREKSSFPTAEAFGQPYLVQTASPAGRIIQPLEHQELT